MALLRKLAPAGVVAIAILATLAVLWTAGLLPGQGRASAIAPLIQQLRVAMTSYYVEQGAFPASVEQIGMQGVAPAPGIEAVSISAAGVIELRVAAADGDPGGRLYHVARVQPTGIDWSCVAETAALAALMPGCSPVAGYVPPTRAVEIDPPPPPRPPARQLLLRSADGAVREGFALDYLTPAAFESLSDESRRNVVAALLIEARSGLIDRMAVRQFAEVLARAGKAALPAFDEALATADGPAAVALLGAACTVEVAASQPSMAEQGSMGLFVRRDAALAALEACLDARHRSARVASESILGDVMAWIKSPEQGVTLPFSSAALSPLDALSGLALHARPHVAELQAILDAYPANPRWPDAALVGRTLLRLGLSDRAQPDAAALAEAGLAGMFAAAFRPVAAPMSDEEFKPQPEPSAAALAARVPWTASLEARFAAVARQVANACMRVHDAGVRGLGPHAVRAILMATEERTACSDPDALAGLLGHMVIRHPESVAQAAQLARSAESREVAIAGLLGVSSGQVGAHTGPTRTALDALGYVPVKVGNNGPVFPGNQVRWPGTRVLEAQDYDAGRLGMLAPELRAALLRALAGEGDCPGTSSLETADVVIWSHPAVPVRLARMRCEAGSSSYSMLASIAPEGTVAPLGLPGRLQGMYESPLDTLQTVTDVDGDGRIEILTRRTIYECDGEEKCEDADVYAYDFSEIERDRFTWFRNR